MKILIADDEHLARQRLRQMVESLGENNIAEVNNGLAVLEYCQINIPDVILLDIRMPGIDGMEVAIKLSELQARPAIIFTTAFPEHAIAAFEVYATDYLLKPIKKIRLEAALKKVCGKTADELNVDNAPNKRTSLCVRVRGNLQKIAIEDILYFRAEQKYVMVCHKEGQVLIEDSLKSLELEFADYFIRIHRNALASYTYLSGMTKGKEGQWLLTLNNVDEKLDISRRHVSALRKVFKGKH